MSWASFLPRRVVGLLALTKLRLAGVRAPAVVTPVATRHSFFIGPANSAGQGYFWARALERVAPRVSAKSLAVVRRDDVFSFPIDCRVPQGFAVHSKKWQKRQFSTLMQFDTVVLESGMAAVPGVLESDPLAQIRALKASGVRVALLFHGSDIRDPDRHLAAEPHSHFRVDSALTEQLRGVTRANKALAASANVVVFVSTPDLVDEVPGAVWLPLVVDAAKWRRTETPFRTQNPVNVVHVPSDSRLKGTDLVSRTLHRLEAEGIISLDSMTRATHDEMSERFGRADVVIDQFRAGSYGVAACEALAAGRVVVSHVSEIVRTRIKEWTGDELPIVEATPERVEAVLREIAAHRDQYRKIAARGPEFISRHHSGGRSGSILASLCFPDETVPVIGREI